MKRLLKSKGRRLEKLRTSSALTILGAICGLYFPASASAFTFNMPAPGTVMVVATWNKTSGAFSGNFIVYQRASDGSCGFIAIGGTAAQGPTQDIIINGTNSADSYMETNWDGSGPKPTVCGVYALSTYPQRSTNGPARFEVNLGGGNDFAWMFVPLSNLVIHGGDGNDYLRYVEGPVTLPSPSISGDGGDDTLFGQYVYGGSGNDQLCSTYPSPSANIADGGSGTDTFCGELDRGGRFSIENFNTSKCPDACRGMFGWP